MKIVMLVSGSPGRGAPHQLMAGVWLLTLGHDVVCLCPGDGQKGYFATPLGDVKVDYVARRLNLAGHLRLLLKLLAYRPKSGRDTIFYVHTSVACPAACLALLFLPSRWVIYHTQDFLEPGRHPHWEFFERWMAHRAGHVICNEPNRARFMASHYGLRKVPAVVRTALPRDWPIPEFDSKTREGILRRSRLPEVEGTRVILNLGQFSVVRCGPQLLSALACLPNRYVLVLTGGGRETPAGISALAHAQKLGVEARTIFLEELPFDELLRFAACCDIGMLLYPNDGIGNYYQAPGRLTEYLSCGLPVVASDFLGLKLVVVEHQIGAVCNPESPQSIAEAIRAIGERPSDDLAADRCRLRRLARTELAYDHDAVRFEEIIGAISAL